MPPVEGPCGLTARAHDRFVARNRRITLARTLENLTRFLDDTLGGAFREVLLGAQRRDLLTEGNVDELVHGYTFNSGNRHR
jgi:hypothetical protein